MTDLAIFLIIRSWYKHELVCNLGDITDNLSQAAPPADNNIVIDVVYASLKVAGDCDSFDMACQSVI